jgi:predicted RND superfamily exporter protein
MFSELQTAVIVGVVIAAVDILIIGLFLYGTHKVSTQNNRNKYFSIIVMYPDFKINRNMVIILCIIYICG